MTIEATFDFSEVEKFVDDFYELSDLYFPAAFQAATIEAGFFFEREARLEAPVDTGRLRASIGHGPEGIWEEKFVPGLAYLVTVGTNVEYAPYMEFGFTMSQGHVAYIKAAGGFRYVHPFTFEGYHYMQKAATKTERVLGAIYERHISEAIAKAGF